MQHAKKPGALRAVVTCGPGVAPLDAVRRITNVSTGELGVLLSERLAAAGWSVVCAKSEASVYRDPGGAGVEVFRFSTNAGLFEQLSALPGADGVRAFFHAAALCDYEVASVTALDGRSLGSSGKIASEEPGLRVELRAAPKILPRLGMLFPNARIVGWKLEFEGDRARALERAARQFGHAGVVLSVVNGPAYGEGFGVLDAVGQCVHVATRPALCAWLAQWASSGAGGV